MSEPLSVSIMVQGYVTLNRQLIQVQYPTREDRTDCVRAMRLWNTKRGILFNLTEVVNPHVVVCWAEINSDYPVVFTDAQTLLNYVIIPKELSRKRVAIVALAHCFGIVLGMRLKKSINNVMNPMSLGKYPMFVSQANRSIARKLLSSLKIAA